MPMVKISGVTRLLYSARPSSISARITSNSESFSIPSINFFS